MMKVLFVMLLVVFVFLIIGMASAQGDEVFLTDGKIISGVSIGVLILLITTAISVGRKTATYDRHMADGEIHVSKSTMEKEFVDKKHCTEMSRILTETRDAIFEVKGKVDVLTDHLIRKEK